MFCGATGTTASAGEAGNQPPAALNSAELLPAIGESVPTVAFFVDMGRCFIRRAPR